MRLCTCFGEGGFSWLSLIVCGSRQNEVGIRKREEASIGRKAEEIEEEEGRKDGIGGCGALTRERLKGMGQRMVGKESRNGAGGMK